MKINNAGCPHGCNSLGQILFKGRWEPCPIHGKKDDYLLQDGKLPNGMSLFDVLQIPYEYRGEWVTDISRLFLNESISTNCVKESIVQLKYILETLYNVFAVENNLYMHSLYIYANPNLIDLKPFMYTLQRVAFENNLSVVPSTSINNLCGLLALQEYSGISITKESDISYISKLNRLAGEGADWFYQTKLNYNDYLRSSVCIILDNGSTLDSNLRMFSGFLEERSRRGLPTYVFSTQFFDTKRENIFYDKLGKRKLSSLNPYILLGKTNEVYAREHGWFNNKSEISLDEYDTLLIKNGLIGGFTLADFQNSKSATANNFEL